MAMGLGGEEQGKALGAGIEHGIPIAVPMRRDRSEAAIALQREWKIAPRQEEKQKRGGYGL